MKMTPQQYCLRWKHHHSNVQNMFAQLLEKERFCDVTLYCSPNFSTQVPNKDTVEPGNIKGVSLRAHRVVLAACSELLGTLLGAHDSLGEPVLVIDGAEPKHLRALLDYMYTGEMSVHHSQLASLLKTAEELRIKGLTDIRWNNKDEPPDCQAGGVITTSSGKLSPERKSEPDRKSESDRKSASPKPKPERIDRSELREKTAMDPLNVQDMISAELRAFMKREEEERNDKYSVNGGPPPLIKLPPKDKTSPVKREHSDTDTQSPKRQRLGSGAEHTDEDSQSVKTERDEWQHGNLDISAERVVGWGGVTSPRASDSEDEWGDAPADIGSFLHTRLRVAGDNSADEESNDSLPLRMSSLPTSGLTSTSSTPSASSAGAGVSPADIKVDLLHAPMLAKPVTKSSGPVDPRFPDVVKLNDYLQHGRRPQFWEENYVRRVMEAVRVKELEMKQAAEILGVSYGTLYGRYRDVYGCINRPYSGQKLFFDRTARDFWQAKGPSEVVERLQRGELTLDAASQALGVAPGNLAAYVADTLPDKPGVDFEPIPIEIDPSLKMKPSRSYPLPVVTPPLPKTRFKGAAAATPPADKASRKVVVGSMEDEDPIPATVITTAPTTTSGKWQSLRVAQLDSLRDPTSPLASVTPSTPTDPSHLMRTRPDLTIVAARKEKDDSPPA